MAKERKVVGSDVYATILNDHPDEARFVSVISKRGRGWAAQDSKTDFFLEIYRQQDYGLVSEATVYLRKGTVQEDGIKMEEIDGLAPVTLRTVTSGGALNKALRKFGKTMK